MSLLLDGGWAVWCDGTENTSDLIQEWRSEISAGWSAGFCACWYNKLDRMFLCRFVMMPVIKKTRLSCEVYQVECLPCSFVSVLSKNEWRLFLSVQCVCAWSSPGRLWQILPCVQTESAAVTWGLLLSSLTSGTAYCCVCEGVFWSAIEKEREMWD